MLGGANTVKLLSVQDMIFIWAHRPVRCDPVSEVGSCIKSRTPDLLAAFVFYKYLIS